MTFALGAVFGQSQEHEIYLPRMPLSPEASMLHQFVDVPVGYFTGTPDINIPLYEITLPSLTIPVSIRYSSSGLKVDQMPTPLGWGWSLDAGGMISHCVIGLDDFQYGGYCSNDLTIFDLPGLTYEEKVAVTSAGNTQATPTLDVQPDIFYYSYPGGGGKFVYDMDGLPHTFPYNPVEISRTEAGYRIKDLSGNIFEYFTKCSSYSYSEYNIDGTSVTSNGYYLSRVVTVNGDILVFNYSLSSSYKQNANEIYVSDVTNREGQVTIDYHPFYYENINLQSCLLTSIVSSRGDSIVFGYTYDGALCKSLDNISVYSKSTAKLIKEVHLYHSYFDRFGSATGVFRFLRLDSIGENGWPGYQFDYYNQDKTTYLNSKSQDLYGYNNGKENTTLIPYESSVGYGVIGNRDPDTAYMKAGVIKSIKYPTGGTTVFEYEKNINSSGEYIGGLRLTSVKEYDSNIRLKERYLSYNDPNTGLSSAISGPVPIFNQSREKYYLDPNVSPYPLHYDYYESKSGTSTGLNGINGGNIGYLYVTELNGAGGLGGKTLFKFSGQGVYGNSGYWPFVPEHNSDGLNGHLVEKTIYSCDSGTFHPVSRTKNVYFQNSMCVIQGAIVPLLFPAYANPDPYPATFDATRIYSYVQYRNFLHSTKERVYLPGTSESQADDSTYYTETSAIYQYDNPAHAQVTGKTTTGSDNVTCFTFYKYPLDYAAGEATGDEMTEAIKKMQADHIVNLPVEVIDKKGDIITGAVLNRYKVSGNHVYPSEGCRAVFHTPVNSAGFIVSEINSSNCFVSDSHYSEQVYYDSFDAVGNLLEYHNKDNIYTSLIWGYDNAYLIAKTESSRPAEVFHTSFEEEPGATVDLDRSKSGESYLRLTTVYLVPKTFPAGTYYLSYAWKERLADPWQWLTEENTLSGDATISTSKSAGYIDELRVCPKNGQMTTCTYEPLVGMTSSTDHNGVTTYYRYDSLRRLECILDNDRNIIRDIQYNYRSN